MFDDPTVVIGVVIGVLIVGGGTAIAVLDHLRKEREAATRDPRDGGSPDS